MLTFRPVATHTPGTARGEGMHLPAREQRPKHRSGPASRARAAGLRGSPPPAQRHRHAEDEDQQQRQPAEGDETGNRGVAILDLEDDPPGVERRDLEEQLALLTTGDPSNWLRSPETTMPSNGATMLARASFSSTSASCDSACCICASATLAFARPCLSRVPLPCSSSSSAALTSRTCRHCSASQLAQKSTAVWAEAKAAQWSACVPAE